MSQAQTESCPSCGSLLDVTGAPIFAERTCPVCETQIHVRREFDHYELLSVMGQGGQGTVFRAMDKNLDRQVALKLLRTEQSGDPAFVKQFEAEARLTASINHPNVVRVFSFGAEEGHVFLAMELVDGGTLDGLMEKLGRIPEAKVLQVGIEIAQGLRAGYEKGLIHRDVKPGNMLFAADGTAKIVDFGLALLLEHEAQESGDIWGTPYYLPPERLNRIQEDFRADIYSLGASLFHAIAGRPPFEAENASQVAMKHLSAKAVSIQAFAPDVSNATAYVINRTLLKNRDERQSSYDEFIKQLQYARDQVIAGKRGGGRVQQKSRVVMEDEKAKKIMSWFTLAAFVVLLIGLIVGGIFIVRGMRGGDPRGGSGVQAGPVALESFGPGWGDARELLLGGEWVKAAAAFRALGTANDRKSPQYEWAVVHEAMAELLGSGGEAAARALGRLPDGSTQVRKFFLEEIRPKLASSERTRASATAGFDRANHEALGLLFIAVRDYELGFVDDAGPLFRQFTGFKADRSVAWLSDYRKLGKPYEEEFVKFSLAADAWKNARNESEEKLAIREVRALPDKLPKGSKLLPKAHQLIAEVDKRIAAGVADRNAGNLAFKAGATASVSNKDDPPGNAVDGDPLTRWSGGGAKQKWLAVDLGSPKNISRWVVRMASSAGGKQEQDLADFTLQCSDDGATWTDVDSVTANRSGIIDRVVPPFSSRRARVLILKETRKPENKTVQIYEFSLGAAGDQARAGYSPSQGVALRFSVATPFVAGPVGDVGVAGSARFEERGGKFTVKGSGGDIWAQADAFHFVWQPVAGDCEIVARIASLAGPHANTKGGLMIRADLGKESSHGGVMAMPGGKVQFVSRKEPGKQSAGPTVQGVALPRWLKIARQGGTIVGYESADGQQWTEVGRETPAGFWPVAFVGMAVCSHANGQLATAEFLDVQVRKTKP